MWTHALVFLVFIYIDSLSCVSSVPVAIQLLSRSSSDVSVRLYASRILQAAHVADLAGCLLQLVQSLKFELHHDSHLARVLVEKGLEHPLQLGLPLYWH
jgi:phosphatidylinositol 3-kinase